ncbi:MAG: sugar phosphate isomerase/epimerase family protein [Dermatophilaceae bacterium]
MADPRGGLDRLSLNTATVKRLSLPDAAEAAARAGIGALGLWRDRVAETGVARSAAILRRLHLSTSSLCRGGFLTEPGDGARRASHDDNRRAIAEAAALGAGELVLVVGGLPDGDRDLTGSRQRVRDRLAELVPVAEEHGVRLALEPLHPMYAADRAVLSTLAQALDWASPHPPEVVGVVVDTFHLWWDPDVATQIARAGAAGRISSYQVCDFLVPIADDPLLSRGVMGDGVIDFAPLTRAVTRAGYTGPVEVEIFNAEIWDAAADQVIDRVIARYAALVAPHLDGSARHPTRRGA